MLFRSASAFFNSRFLLFLFFFGSHLLTLRDNINCYEQCIHCSHTVHTLFIYYKILKMGPTILFTYLKIILLQCFQFSIFSFQFSATISSIQTHPITVFLKNFRRTVLKQIIEVIWTKGSIS